MKKKVDRVLDYINYDIWRMRPGKELPKKKVFLVRQLRTFILAVRGFLDDNCMLRASALTFYTLMSIVPVFAMAFGFAKGFGYDQVLKRELIDNFSTYQALIERLLVSSDKMLENTKGGVIAGVGVFVLLWTVIKLLGNIEFAFNRIWGVKKGRTFIRKVVDYVIILFIATIFLVIASSVNVFVTSFLGQYTESIFDPLIYVILKFLPFVLIWFVFIFIYIVIPNIRVSVKAAVISGIITGTIFQLVQGIYIDLQFGMAKYNAIYGSFAALPLFLMWLEISWMIVLFGAELAYANQNVDTYDFEPDARNASIYLQRLVAVYIVTAVCKQFEQCLPPFTEADFSEKMDIPPRLVRKVLFDLTQCGIIIKIIDEDDGDRCTYMPFVNPQKLSLQFVLEKLEHFGSEDIPIKQSPEFVKVKEKMEQLKAVVASSEVNVLLKDL
jgi:membrane protein